MQKTFLLISGCFKGQPFIQACKEAGNHIFLVTSESLRDEPWPHEFIDEIFYMPGDDQNWNMEDLTAGTAHILRKRNIDRIVALDDFDVEKATHLREHFRIPGMGQTTGRYFRDKLAMRMRAQEAGLPVPAFSPLFNDEAINKYADSIEAPWVVKPRGEASATGIKKVHSKEELWEVIHNLGDKRDQYLVEQFKPGDVYHVDALSQNGKLEFCRVSKYIDTPFDVAHGGGIFRSAIVPFGSKEDKALQELTAQVMTAFGMQFSASHTEFIQNRADGKFYFLETASRVGGAHLAEMVEASSGINLWAEWAKLETAVANEITYKLPKVKKDYAGIIVSLAREKHPDTSSFTDPEIWWRLKMDYHIGMIVKSKKPENVKVLLDRYAEKVNEEFHASAPSK